jgi:hypothetical protein
LGTELFEGVSTVNVYPHHVYLEGMGGKRILKEVEGVGISSPAGRVKARFGKWPEYFMLRGKEPMDCLLKDKTLVCAPKRVTMFKTVIGPGGEIVAVETGEVVGEVVKVEEAPAPGKRKISAETPAPERRRFIRRPSPARVCREMGERFFPGSYRMSYIGDGSCLVSFRDPDLKDYISSSVNCEEACKERGKPGELEYEECYDSCLRAVDEATTGAVRLSMEDPGNPEVLEGIFPTRCWAEESERLSLIDRLERVGCSAKTRKGYAFEGMGEICHVSVEGRPGGCRLPEVAKAI